MIFSRNGNKKHFFLCILAFASFPLLMGGCASSRSLESRSPAWWVEPHKHDTRHLYFKAQGESSQSLEYARKNAFRSLQGHIAEYIFSDVRVVVDNMEACIAVKSLVELREVEVFKEDEVKHQGQWVVWMLGRYPQSEYERIKKRLELASEIEVLWSRAQSAVNGQQDSVGEETMLNITTLYDKALRVSFDLDAVKLELAALYLRQNRGLKARQWIVDVQKSTTNDTWRKKADVLFEQIPPLSLKDVFEGRNVGVYCCTREGGVVTMNSDMAQALNARLAKDGIKTIVASERVLKSNTIFDSESMKKIAHSFLPHKSDVVFLTLLDIDSGKRGEKINIPGTDAQVDAYDARLFYWIIRSRDGFLMASDSTVGFSTASNGLLNTILIHQRHLPRHAPVIIEQLGADESVF